MTKFSSLLLRIPHISVHFFLSHVNSKVGFPYLVLRDFQFTGKSIKKLTCRSYTLQDAEGGQKGNRWGVRRKERLRRRWGREGGDGAKREATD